MSSRMYYRGNRYSRSAPSRKRLYGSAYQYGKTTKYQRYGRTVPLDPGYANMPNNLPTRQSQLAQLEELRKAGLIPSPELVNLDVQGDLTLTNDLYAARGSTFSAVCPVHYPTVEGVITRPEIAIDGGGEAYGITIPIIENDVQNRILYVNYGAYLRRSQGNFSPYLKMYDRDDQQIYYNGWNTNYLHFQFGLNTSTSSTGTQYNNLYYSTSQSQPLTNWAQENTNTKLTDIGSIKVYEGSGNSNHGTNALFISLKSLVIHY